MQKHDKVKKKVRLINILIFARLVADPMAISLVKYPGEREGRRLSHGTKCHQIVADAAQMVDKLSSCDEKADAIG